MMRSGLAVVLLVLVSCGGSDGGNEAPAKCDALVTRTCLRFRECRPNAQTQAECEATLKTDLPCALAFNVGPGYSSCISEIDASPCSVLFTANNMINSPASCAGVILVPPP